MGRKPSKKQLTKAEKYYIEGHIGSQNTKEISYDLRIPESLIVKYLERITPKSKQVEDDFEDNKVESKTNESTDDSNTLKTKNLFVRKKDRGVVVMTREAAELGDAVKKKKPAAGRDCIHEINPE